MRHYVYRASRPVKELAEEQAVRPLIRSRTGLIPISEHAADDVFIVGYPKSGNTWFQNLASGVVFGVNPLFAPDPLVQELVPDVHYKRYYRRYWDPMFFKSHHMPQPDYARVVYLVRDGRDALVSFFHYNKAVWGQEPDFTEMARTGAGLMGKWHEHVEAWLANPHAADMVIIRYEDLQQDPVRELERFCQFVGLERDRPWLELVAANAAFEKMQGKEKSGKYLREDPAWPRDKLFNRRGVVGSYKDEMPPEVLDAFLQEAGETLARFGYV